MMIQRSDSHQRLTIIEGEADAVLAASVFHFGELTVRQVKESMRDAGIPVRL